MSNDKIPSLLTYDVPFALSDACGKLKRSKCLTVSLKRPPLRPISSSPSLRPQTASSANNHRDIGNITMSASQTREVIDSILPPREWKENGHRMIQHVSCCPTTRPDLILLQEELERSLVARRAKETGFCPVRRELYSQLFDELIRQVTLGCVERGLLLLRVRDEIKTTLTAYSTLYESSTAFGMRKALQAEMGKKNLEAKIWELEVDKRNLDRQLSELKVTCERAEKDFESKHRILEMKHQDEISFLKKTNQQMKMQLEGILKPSKKQLALQSAEDNQQMEGEENTTI